MTYTFYLMLATDITVIILYQLQQKNVIAESSSKAQVMIPSSIAVLVQMASVVGGQV